MVCARERIFSIIFSSLYLLVFVFLPSSTASGVEQLRNNKTKIQCSQCDSCLIAPFASYTLRRDEGMKSFCYTEIRLVQGTPEVRRGVARPPSNLIRVRGGLQPKCPNENPDFTSYKVFYCYCSENDCNNVSFNVLGYVDPKVHAKKPKMLPVPEITKTDYLTDERT